MTEQSVYNFTVSFRVTTDADFEDITKILQIDPTRIYYKGETLSRVLNLRSLDNVWEISKNYYDCSGNEELIRAFFSEYSSIKENIEHIKGIGVPRLHLSYNSECAMFGYFLSPCEVGVLNELGVPVEFSFFSWGMIRDE